MSTDCTFFRKTWRPKPGRCPMNPNVKGMLYRNNLKRQKGLMISIIIEKHSGLAVFMYGILC